MYNIGVVGYSAQDFNEEKAKEKIIEAFDKIEKKHSNKQFSVVSGHTDLGVPALAYREADKRGYKTIGVSCERSHNYDLYDVDESIIIGKDWGDESSKFLSMVDCLVKIGVGEQSKREARKAKDNGIRVEYSSDI